MWEPVLMWAEVHGLHIMGLSVRRKETETSTMEEGGTRLQLRQVEKTSRVALATPEQAVGKTS